MAKDNSVYVARLRRLAQKWGGDILDINTYKNGFYNGRTRFGGSQWMSSADALARKEFSEAPFSSKELGVIYKEKLVLCEKETPWPQIVHEMGHVFASSKTPKNSQEGEFFGWEVCVVKHIRAPIHEWYDSNADYGLGSFSQYPGLAKSDHEYQFLELGALSPRERLVVIRHHIEESRKLGLIDKHNRPLAIR